LNFKKSGTIFSVLICKMIFMPEIHYLVPAQVEGLKKDVTQNLAADSTEAAEDLFVDAKERLLDVNNWRRYSALPNVVFQLTDGHGHPVKRRARRGDHIRLDLTGIPGSFDWVAIESIEYDDYPDLNMETFAFRLRPCLCPLQHDAFHPVLHPSEASSTFVIERRGRMLFSTFHGRNECEDGDPILESFHDMETLTTSSAWLGLTDVECVALVKGFIH
jgi:hypothetical protein